MPTTRTVRNSLTVLAGAAVLAGTLVGVAGATPPGIPSAATAKSDLAGLTVKADGSLDGYSRAKFPHWIDQGNNCNTREVVLKRDGTNVKTGSDCAPTSGSWFSPYDGATWTAASDVDIDHVVPLADAWRTGASAWTTAQRQAYANDLSDPQLIAVTDNVNQQKGDKSPDQWKPPLTGYWCTYAEMWVAVKAKFDLTVNTAEKSALTDMLGRC
ncbi:HNH endonuclease family protein [Amycolatopsis sp. PS_44_ISF1]|uniref:HNH endonuclease family protein n=1 Tax=Amycolatopsis sp. PS_44_ISF1 TaxID=2974917 RepID=UPI0028E04423|nr:HNH endonuclease family protein [Amycolatopsis sp. PS_44_ISF1]MDT8910657.1 HNH endonuclease family protein [Amycolatopsis sp. PS_44_ISF1]